MVFLVDCGCTKVFALRVLPVSNGETHGVAHDNDGHDSISSKIAVRVDAIRYGYLATDSDACTKHIHCEYKSEPVHIVCCANTP